MDLCFKAKMWTKLFSSFAPCALLSGEKLVDVEVRQSILPDLKLLIKFLILHK